MAKKIRMGVVSIPETKVMINVGCLFDIPTGEFIEGVHGEMLLNGGLGAFEGIVGIGNTGKSAITTYRNITAAYRIGEDSALSYYDTESSIHKSRIRSCIHYYTGEDPYTWFNDDRVTITDFTLALGGEWFNLYRDTAKEKVSSKDYLIDTPFKRQVNSKEYLQIPIPTFVVIDSISNFATKETMGQADDNEVGSKETKTIDMNLGKAKSEFVFECQYYAVKSYTYTTLVGHMGKLINMSQYETKVKQLPSLKSEVILKGASPKFTYLTNNCWYLVSSNTMQDSKKSAEYPRSSDGGVKGDVDLKLVTLYQLRCKSGQTELTLPLVLSQTEGVLASLTEFHYLKLNDYFGLNVNGNKSSFACELYPDVKFTRITVRDKLREDKLLARAIQMCADLHQLKTSYPYRDLLDQNLFCEPKMLYEDILNLGYDWSVLLDTVNWWSPIGVHEDKRFLSILDLLRIRQGLYHPYWLDKDKKTILKAKGKKK